MTEGEFENWKSHFATSNKNKMGLRKRPFVFTQDGVAMLSSVLNSERAIQVNIQIMRAFSKLREIMLSHKDLAQKIGELERKFKDHDQRFVIVFDAIRKLMAPPPEKKKTFIGFHP